MNKILYVNGKRINRDDWEIEFFHDAKIEDYDEERVYISDIKKVFQWYNALHSSGLVKLPKEEKKKIKTKKEDE